MGANNLLYEEGGAQLLNSVISQMTGKNPVEPISTANFITQAQTALLTGYEPVLNAISQVLSRTIFSARAYNGSFPGFMVDNEKYGNHIRKVNYGHKGYEESADTVYNLKDGDSVDMYKISKLPVLQTNFYGWNPYKFRDTTFMWQMDAAFRGPGELAQFMAGKATTLQNEFISQRDATTRMTLANFIAAKTIVDPDNVIHLVAEYNKQTGAALTTASVREPDNWGNFTRWFYGFMETISDMMTNRSINRHLNFNNFNFYRHTPVGYQKLYLSSYILNSMRAEVLSMTFNDRVLRMADFSPVAYWQGESEPNTINITPSYTDNTGAVVKADAPVKVQNIMGILFDYEAMGMTVQTETALTTPVNADGAYWNTVWHWNQRWWNDLTENAIVFLLDDGTAGAQAAPTKLDPLDPKMDKEMQAKANKPEKE